MRSLIYGITLLGMGISSNTLAQPHECPFYPTKTLCLKAVDETYQQSLDYLLQDYEGDKEPLVEAAVTIRNYESLACGKTCIN